jgi:Tol biopolymer transport system component
VGSNGGAARAVATDGVEASVPAWSRDGRWLFFGGIDQIFKVRPEGGAPIQITRQGGFAPEASPDGRRVYYGVYASGDSVLWSASVEGGDERPVPGMPHLRGDLGFAWTVAEKGIYFVSAEKGTRVPGIDSLDFAGGRTQRVVDLTGRPALAFGGRPAVSPDGGRLLFTQIDEVKSDLMLVENFR